MLDYTALTQQFDEILASITPNELKEWIEFDEQRLAKNLISGKSIILESSNTNIIISIMNDKLMEITTNANDAYAMAA